MTAAAWSRGLDAARREIGYFVRAPERVLPLPGTHAGYVRFLIVCDARSGSTMLVERCRSHPNVRCFGELFQRGAIRWDDGAGARPTRLLDLRLTDPSAFLARHVWRRYPRRTEAVGFKLHFGQLLTAPKGLRSHVASVSGLRVLRLERRNLLAAYLSLIAARQTGIWESPLNGGQPVFPPITLDPGECERFFENRALERSISAALLKAHPALELSYENLVGDPERENARICRFLEVEARPLSHRLEKLARQGLPERIANFDALRRHFAGTRWASFFDVS